MKRILKLVTFFVLSSTLFFSCKDDEKTEITYDNLAVEKASVTLDVGQQDEVKITSGSGVYKLKNKNVNIVSAVLEGTVIKLDATNEGGGALVVTDIKTEQTKKIAIKVVKVPNLLLESKKVELELGSTKKIMIKSGSGKYEVASKNQDIATADLDGGNIVVVGLQKGNTEITVTDIKSMQVQTLSVRVIQPRGTYETVLIKAGKFKMGSPVGRGKKNEHPQHEVIISKDFYIGKYEVTNAQFVEFLNAKGNQEEGGEKWLDIGDKFCQIEKVGKKYKVKNGLDNYPVIDVSWFGARAFAEWIGGRLPTEAEWEYVAKAGSDTHRYSGSDTIDEVAWFWTNSFNSNNEMYKGRGTHEVGTKKANEFGVYDMTGNVWEWCNDWYTPYREGTQTDPKGPDTGTARCGRGAAWDTPRGYCAVTFRFYLSPRFSSNAQGLRVVFDK